MFNNFLLKQYNIIRGPSVAWWFYAVSYMCAAQDRVRWKQVCVVAMGLNSL